MEATMCVPRLLAVLFPLLVFTASTAAQPVGTDLLLVTNLCNMPNLWRLSPFGGLTSVGRIGYCGLHGITLDVDNRSVVVSDQTPSVMRVDPLSGRVIATIWSGPPLPYYPEDISVDQNGDYLFCAQSFLYKLKRDGSSITTFYAYPVSPHSIRSYAEDKGSGDWILGRGVNGAAIVRVDRDTWTVKFTRAGLPPNLTAMAADPQRRAIYTGGSCCAPNYPIYKFEPATNTLTTFSNGSAYAITVDRSPARDGSMIYTGDCSTSQCAIQRWNRSGAFLGTVGVLPNAGINGMVFDGSRNLAPILIAAPNDRVIRLSFPGDAGRSYVLALSLSGYTPGIGLADGRVIPLNPDALTFLTATQPIPPVLTGNVGVLRATAEGVVMFNANPLGSAVKNVRVWAAALTLDPQAPLGISQISGPLLFVL